MYGATPLSSYYAVKVYGPGHVVCHNYIAYFHDAVCVCTHGSPPQERERQPSAIDIYNNDIHLMADDFIEADGGMHNIRVLRNRCFNAAQCGLSAQPVFGGPAYFVRNILYHVPWGLMFKFKVKPAGLLVYHNTIIAESRSPETYSNAHFRNNLFLGTDSPAANCGASPWQPATAPGTTTATAQTGPRITSSTGKPRLVARCGITRWTTVRSSRRSGTWPPFAAPPGRKLTG